MADDPNKRRPQDALFVSINQPHEVRYWSEKLGVTEDKLKEAVRAAGPSAQDVQRHLKK